MREGLDDKMIMAGAGAVDDNNMSFLFISLPSVAFPILSNLPKYPSRRFDSLRYLFICYSSPSLSSYSASSLSTLNNLLISSSLQ